MITYIVVTEKNRWGKGKTVVEAFANAGLKSHTPINWFSDYLECEWDLAEATRDWKEYGRDETIDLEMDDGRVACMIYIFDDGPSSVWKDFNIDDIGGGVSYISKDDCLLTRVQKREEYDKCWQRCYWEKGELTIREA
jgi:hypothetical protein